MFATLRKKFRWSPISSPDKTNNYHNSLILIVFLKLLEDVLFWKSMWLSLLFIFSWHIIYLVCVYRDISLVKFILCLIMTGLLMDAFESWLKYKHRTAFLKRITQPEPTKLISMTNKLNQWITKQWRDFIHVREINHTKAFLLVNILLGTTFFFVKYINNYLLLYLFCMFCSVCYKVIPPISKVISHILQDLESEAELEGLVPDASEVDIKLLSIEPERTNVDEKQSLDYWKPEDVPIEEISDSSENSSSVVTNFSMEKVQTLQKDVDTSDSSEDEYIPLDQHKEQLQTTLEVAEPSNSWSSSAYNALWNLTGVVTNIMQSEKKRKRVSSVDSSDGFEMVDQNDLN